MIVYWFAMIFLSVGGALVGSGLVHKHWHGSDIGAPMIDWGAAIGLAGVFMWLWGIGYT